MKSKLVILLVIALMTAGLSACGLSDMFTHSHCYGTKIDNHIMSDRR